MYRFACWSLFALGCGVVPDSGRELTPTEASAGAAGGTSSGAAGATSTGPMASAGAAAIVVSAPPVPPSVPQTPTPTPSPSPLPSTPLAELPPLFAEPVRQSARAVPISGGTLLVTEDGTTAVAADPDRDRVFLVDMATRSVRAVAVALHDEPGRVVEGAGNTLYVAARSGGVVLVVDRARGVVTQRFPACNAPRGLAFDATSSRVYVACRSGRLVALDATTGAIEKSFDLGDDLRDVLVQGDELVVSRFRSAELLFVDGTGAILRRASPLDDGVARPAVAFRAVRHPSGSILMAHQLESRTPLGTEPGGYGSFTQGCGARPPAGAVVQQWLTAFPADTAEPAPAGAGDISSTGASSTDALSTSVRGAVGPLDVAVARDGKRVAVVATGNSWLLQQEQPTLYVSALSDARGYPPSAFAGCNGESVVARHLPGEPVAVAFDAAGRYVVQSREPAMLALEGDVIIPLSDDSRFDTGLAMFHMSTGNSGLSCASCHPEGGDDGHVWSFASLGLRRSQSLEGGVIARAPFHWQGDLATFDVLFEEVMIGRMALPVVPPEPAREALARWLDTIPRPAPADALDPTSVERGRERFTSVGCATCHSGPSYGDDLAHDVGTGRAFITPALIGVGLRAPLMHDGCARTLRERFGPCGGTAHGETAGLTPAEIDDLVAFMKSL